MPAAQIFIEKLIASLNAATRKIIIKGAFLVREGEVERNAYFIEDGAVVVFHLSEFEEQVIRFGYKGSFITSLSSFIKGTPSEFYIEAIRKTTVRIISKETIMNIAHENRESLVSYTNFLESLVTQQIEREIDLLTVSPSERLKRVLQRSPDVFQQIPLKYIASYLRMKPETLSRIRNS